MASEDYMRHWSDVCKEMPHLRAFEVPGPDHFQNNEPARHYSFDKPWSVASEQPSFVIHSSGTTGNPKPLVWSHRATSRFVHEKAQDLLSAPADLKYISLEAVHSKYLVNPLPLCWGAALFYHVYIAIMADTINIWLPSSSPFPMDADSVDRTTQLIPQSLPSPMPKVSLMVIPTVLRELSARPESVARLRDTYYRVAYLGAPLDEATGDALVEQGVSLYSLIASTETALYPTLTVDSKDWKYFRIPPEGSRLVVGYALEYFAEGDKYELVINKLPDDPRPCFHSCPNDDVFHTKDLWQAVPGRAGLWQGVGRVDDFVKIANLIKFNAVQIERGLDKHTDVIQGSVVAGDGRTKPFVMIQPTQSLRALGQKGMLDRIEALFQEANKNIFHEAHLTRELVLITDESKPIRRTAKGTVDRRNTLAMYEHEIDALYADLQNGQVK